MTAAREAGQNEVRTSRPARRRSASRAPQVGCAPTNGKRLTLRGPRREEGTAVLLAILIMGAISVLGTTMVLNSMTERQIGTLHWERAQALSAAETGLAFCVRLIQDMNAPLTDRDSDGRPDFVVADTLADGSRYRVVAEASDAFATGASLYQTERFTLVAEGRRGQAVRRVSLEIGHDSFLKYARFCADGTPGFDCAATITGEFYAKGPLTLPVDCGKQAIQFLEPVTVRDEVTNPDYAIFHRDYYEFADLIDLKNSVDFNALRDRARGLLSFCDCEGHGEAGIYCRLKDGDFPLLKIAGAKTAPYAFEEMKDAMPVIRELDLGLFDFFDTATSPGDTLVTYGGYGLRHPATGSRLRAEEFNGLLFCEDDMFVRGRLDGKSGRSLTIVASNDIYVLGDLITGHTGYDLKTGLATGTGEPVNLGLVAKQWIRIDTGTPRVLRIDAALLSVEESWRAEGKAADHPPATVTVYDLDLDGIAGESPYNDDPLEGFGWDEQKISAVTWMLNITGPIITWKDADSGPWKDSAVLAAASGPTRRYNYDMDILSYPPPCFPVPVNLWRELSWSEIRDTQKELLSYVLVPRLVAL